VSLLFILATTGSRLVLTSDFDSFHAAMPMNRRILLARRPEGLLAESDFRLDEQPAPVIQDGQALLKTLYLGIDPTIRTWLSTARSYLPPIEIGEVVRSAGVGRVVESRCERFAVGDLVTHLSGWQEYSVVTDNSLATSFPGSMEPRHALGLLGSTGVAAYVGLLDVGRPQAGETVVVSAAAGGTGSIVGQLATVHGCRAVGIAGSDEKCRHVVEELGFDACINYKSEGFREALKAACPKRIDIYFDNVGGWILNEALGRLNMGARVVLCGAISVYNEAHKPPGPSNYLNLITVRGKMIGFNGMDHWGRHAQIAADLQKWMQEGKLKYHEHVFEGLEQAWKAVNALFTGENRGKVLVRVAED
jgi:NADPH-dependent curcumin reductase CurA